MKTNAPKFWARFSCYNISIYIDLFLAALRNRFCVVGIEHACGIHQRRAGIHCNCDTKGFRDLFAGSAEFVSFVCMNRDAAVAPRRDGNGERNKLSRLRIKMTVLAVCCAENAVPLTVSGLNFASSPTVASTCCS